MSIVGLYFVYFFCHNFQVRVDWGSNALLGPCLNVTGGGGIAVELLMFPGHQHPHPSLLLPSPECPGCQAVECSVSLCYLNGMDLSLTSYKVRFDWINCYSDRRSAVIWPRVNSDLDIALFPSCGRILYYNASECVECTFQFSNVC